MADGIAMPTDMLEIDMNNMPMPAVVPAGHENHQQGEDHAGFTCITAWHGHKLAGASMEAKSANCAIRRRGDLIARV